MPSETVVDLCSGTGGLSEAFVKAGWNVVRVDNDRRFSKVPYTVIADVVKASHGWSESGLPEITPPTVVVAGPVCTEYSLARNFHPELKGKAPDLDLWRACRFIADWFDAPLILENVAGAQRWWGKSTWHWGAFHIWDDLGPTRVPGRAPLKEGNQFTPGHRAPHLRATVPLKLSEAILRQVQRMGSLT